MREHINNNNSNKIIYCMLCAGHHLYYSLNNPMTWVWLLNPFYRWENWTIRRCYLPRLQAVGDMVRIKSYQNGSRACGLHLINSWDVLCVHTCLCVFAGRYEHVLKIPRYLTLIPGWYSQESNPNTQVPGSLSSTWKYVAPPVGRGGEPESRGEGGHRE